MRSVRYLPAVLVAAALLTAGCTASSGTGPQPPSTTSMPSTSATPPGSSTPSTPSDVPTPIGRPAHGYLASEADKGHTVTLHVGDELVIELHSTYWGFDQPNPGTVLAVEHPPAATPSGRCVPGGGCGTVTVVYRAVAPGTATASANRNSCGEAMACQEEQAHYRLTVVVN